MLNWFKWTLAFTVMGLLATPLIMIALMGYAGCCSGGNPLWGIPILPILPWWWLWRQFPNDIHSWVPMVVINGLGYGLLPTYFVLGKKAWKRLFKRSTP